MRRSVTARELAEQSLHRAHRKSDAFFGGKVRGRGAGEGLLVPSVRRIELDGHPRPEVLAALHFHLEWPKACVATNLENGV